MTKAHLVRGRPRSSGNNPPPRHGAKMDAVTIAYGLACILGPAFVRGYSGTPAGNHAMDRNAPTARALTS
jgi:hypothetical protein